MSRICTAPALGDVLVVAVNSDDSIRRLKGPERPINSLEDRMGVLAGLGCIDYVVAFDENTPHAVIRAVRPHIFVKGGDYTRETLPEANLVESLDGEVVILQFLPDHSTSRMIQRIREVSLPLLSPTLEKTEDKNGHASRHGADARTFCALGWIPWETS